MNAQYFRQFIWREIAKLRLRSSILYLRDQANLTCFNFAKYALNRVFIIATIDNETLCRSGDWPAVSRLADNIPKSINMQCYQNTKALLLCTIENKGYSPLPGLSYICVIYK